MIENAENTGRSQFFQQIGGIIDRAGCWGGQCLCHYCLVFGDVLFCLFGSFSSGGRFGAVEPFESVQRLRTKFAVS